MKNLHSFLRRCLLLGAALLAAAATPALAQHGGEAAAAPAASQAAAATAAAPQAVPADARCPVCGMYPARYPRWAAQLRYSDGERRYFDSPVEMLRFLADVPRYDAEHTASDVQARWLSDASGSGQWIAFENAWVVHGSDALGPMRAPDLPAFASEEAARHFAKEHGGHAVKAAELPRDLQHSLTAAHAHGHATHASAPAHEHGHGHTHSAP